MKKLSFRIRLAAWYFLVLSFSFCTFGLIAYQQMRHSILSAIDDELLNRSVEFEKLLKVPSESSPKNYLYEKVTPHIGNHLVQIADERGDWLYRSPVMLSYASKFPRIGNEKNSEIVTVKINGEPLRVLTSYISFNGERYSLQIAEQIRGYETAIKRFGIVMLFSLPILLITGSIGGYWMSRRALEPVDQITRSVVAITAQNLSRRLDVPEPNDELRRLSQTLNSMLERLQEAFQRITQFTADASHELRTPLAYMRTMAEVSLKRPRSEVDYRETLFKIVNEIQTTTDLVDRLLFLARADTGSEQLDKKRIDLIEIVRETSTEGQLMANTKQIDFHTDLPTDVLWTDGDRQSLKRLFLILVDNAIKYTPAGGEVKIVLNNHGNFVIFEVSDSGIGISDSDLPHIFERFYRAHKARSRETGGEGLGLSIGQYIAEAHGGRIEVRSELGRGSVFRVYIPLLS